jgi:hypothetical protein
MRLRRPSSAERQPNAGFDWREIVCNSEDAAKAEVERQQALDDDNQAEWIYLKNEKSENWVARRTPRHLELPQMSMRRAFFEWLTNPFDWLRGP